MRNSPGIADCVRKGCDLTIRRYSWIDVATWIAAVTMLAPLIWRWVMSVISAFEQNH
jgi:hypothetical protein